MISYDHPRIQRFLIADYDKALENLVLTDKQEQLFDELVISRKLYLSGLLSNEKYINLQKKALKILKNLIKEQL